MTVNVRTAGCRNASPIGSSRNSHSRRARWPQCGNRQGSGEERGHDDDPGGEQGRGEAAGTGHTHRPGQLHLHQECHDGPGDVLAQLAHQIDLGRVLDPHAHVQGFEQRLPDEGTEQDTRRHRQRGEPEAAPREPRHRRGHRVPLGDQLEDDVDDDRKYDSRRSHVSAPPRRVAGGASVSGWGVEPAAVASPVASPVTPHPSDRVLLPHCDPVFRRVSPGSHGGHVPAAHVRSRCRAGPFRWELLGGGPPLRRRRQASTAQRAVCASVTRTATAKIRAPVGASGDS